MSEHKLKPGKQLIQGIEELGIVLGYHVKKEYPVDKPAIGAPSSIDVAWFSKELDLFPLFIFEVESMASSGMASNPLKVYSQDSRSFEKPLFFFHVILRGGALSAKPSYLEAQYGKNNYRIYHVGEDSANLLIQDVLNQHARIRSDIDYISFHHLLNSKLWKNIVDHVSLIRHSTRLGLSSEEVIANYINLTRSDRSLLPDLLRFIDVEADHNYSNTNLGTYIGSQWFVPVLCSMCIGLNTTKKDIAKWSTNIIKWQNESSFMPMITTRLGLSSDYDEFLLGCAPQLMTLCIGLSAAKGDFPPIFMGILEELISEIGVCWAGLNVAIYLLHISACLKLEASYDKAKEYLLKFGSISINDIYCPPSVVSVMDGDFEDYYHEGEELSIPSINKFSEICMDKYRNNENDTVAIALKALDDDSYIYEWANDLLSNLWTAIDR